MVHPLPPLEKKSRKGATGLGSVVLVVLAVVAWWWLSGGEPGTPTGTPSSFTSVPAATPSSSSSASPSSSSPTSSPTSSPSRSSPDEADEVDPESGLPWIDEADLPDEALEVLDVIEAGGPYDYPDRDDTVFGNYEGLLPAHERGYYREYTVVTPGEYGRGPRRLVVGDEWETYWTVDHYESFERVRW